MGFFGAQGAPGLFCYLFYLLLNFIFSLRRGRFLFFDPLYAFLNFIFIPSTRSGRAGPLLSGQQKVGKDRRKGVSPPCESPDQSGVLDAPLWKPPSPRWRAKEAIKLRNGRTPRRLRGWSFGAVGESRERVRARLRCRTSTASFGGCAPLPPAFPKGESLLVMRVWGLRPLAPCVPQRGKFADHARQRMVPRPKRLLQATPPQICAEAPAAKRLGVPSLPSRGCGRRPL